MSILDRHKRSLQQWGLEKIPFQATPPSDPQDLARIFHGRESEIEKILPTLYEGRNVLIRGGYGIGKTALITKSLDQLGQEVSELDEQMLILYLGGIPVFTAADLYRTLLLAVVNQMSDFNDRAKAIQESLTGLYMEQSKTTLDGKVTLAFASFGVKQDLPSQAVTVRSLGDPYQLLMESLDQAEAYFSKIVIAIDDMDKQDVSAVQGILEGSLDLFRRGDRRGFLLTGRGFTELQEVTLRALGIFAEDIALPPMNSNDLRQIAINNLNLVRFSHRSDAYPFVDEVIDQIADYAQGTPRQLNHLCYRVLRQAQQEGCEEITQGIFTQLWIKLQQEVSYSLSPHILRLLSVAYKSGGIDEDITNEQLDQLDMNAYTFGELLPILKELEKQELLIQREDLGGIRFIPSKLFIPPDPSEP